MATIADLLIKIGVMDEASAGLQKFGTEAEEAGAKSKSFGGVVSETSEGVLKSLGKTAAFMGVMGAAFEGGEFIKGGIEAAESLQKSQESLDTAIEKTGGSVDKLGPKFEDVAKAQADYGISQQAANQGLAESVLMAGGAEKGMRAYEEAVVLSKGAHIGLDAAIRATAKAQEGVTSGLTRYGIVMKPGLSSTQQLASVMKVWGGQAEANTLDSDRLSAKFKNLQATVGGALLPIFLKAADEFARFIDWLQLAYKWVGKNEDVIAPLAAAIGAITGAVVAWRIATAAWTVATDLATAAQTALNVALDANPIGIVILALVGLAAALVVLWHRSQEFRDIVTGTWNELKTVTVAVIDFIKAHWRAGIVALAAIVLGPLGALVALIATHWSTVKHDATAAWDTVKSVITGAVNGVHDVVAHVFGSLDGIISKAGSAIGRAARVVKAAFQPIIDGINAITSAVDAAIGAISKMLGLLGKVGGLLHKAGGILSHIPGFATGVRNFQGGLAVVGENGPELVNLPSGSDVFTNAESRRMAGGTGGPLIGHVTVQNDVDIEVLANRVARKLAFQS